MKLTLEEVRALAAQFVPSDEVGDPKPFGDGHINDTYLFGNAEERYVLQRINKVAFPHPEQVMDNMLRVTAYLREGIEQRGGNPARETLKLLSTLDGAPFAIDRNDDCWRVYTFVAKSVCYDHSDDENIFCEAGHAFGRFLAMLDGFDASSLYETIVRFHDTPSRFCDFHRAVEQDAAGRAASVRELIGTALDYETMADALTGALRDGKLPLRVTHNDTKLNNVLIDENTGHALCVIDLDTVMPGLSAYDFGDAIRFGASTAAEDEQDLDKVHFSLPMFHAFAQGYLEEVAGMMNEAEIDSLPMGAKMMTLETGIRFLGDYLNGDVYFKTAYPEHNLVRARTQFKLLAEMDAHWDEMTACVRQLAAKKGSEQR